MQIHQDVELSQLLWYRIGGRAKYLLCCSSEQDVIDAVEFIKRNNILHHFVVGTGANLLFTDNCFNGAVIQILDSEGKNIRVAGKTIEAFAGERLSRVCEVAFGSSLIGLEWAGGLPGTLGAAVRGNAGAFGGEIRNSIQTVTLIDTKAVKTHHLQNSEMCFAYRHSLIKEDRRLIVLSARLQLQRVTSAELAAAKKAYEGNILYRKTHHPCEHPNSGSTFKNLHDKDQVTRVLAVWPDIRERVETVWQGKVSMGYVIYRLGFSGYRVGNAQVATQHANFINNLGGARSEDIRAIIRAIQKQCEETFGFLPEIEVEIVE